MRWLLSAVVPQLDGGALLPLLQFLLASTRNSSSPAAEFSVVDEVDENTTVVVAGQRTQEVNWTFVDAGQFVVAWYAGRARAQAPLFCCFGACWLLLLLLLLLLRLLVRRHRRRRSDDARRRSGRSLATIKFLAFAEALGFVLLLLSLLLVALHWAGRGQLQPLAAAQPAGSNSSDSSDISSSSNSSDSSSSSTIADSQQQQQQQQQQQLLSAFRASLRRAEQLVEAAIVDTNRTVVSECVRAQPQAVALAGRAGGRLLSLLSADLRLTPLLETFDAFLAAVKATVDSMRRVSAAPDESLARLRELTGVVRRQRSKLQELLADVCGDGASADVAAECPRLRRQLGRFTVRVDAARVKSDTSTAIVTLLKAVDLNLTEVERQVVQAKRQLYGSLDSVQAQVAGLFDLAVEEASWRFTLALAEAEDVRRGLRDAGDDAVLLRVLSIVDHAVAAANASAAAIAVTFLLALLASLLLCSHQLWLHHQQLRLAADDDADWTARATLLRDFAEKAAPADAPTPPTLPTPRLQPPPAWLLNFLTCTGCLLLLLLLYGFAFFYAGAELQQDACRYVNEQEGVEVVDRMLTEFVDERVWPELRRRLVSAPLPLRLGRDAIPNDTVAALLRHCGNESTTVFQILGLDRLLNVTELLNSPAAAAAIGEGREALLQMVRQLNTSQLVPQEVGVVLGAVLPRFAQLVDEIDLSSSIEELARPPLDAGTPQLQRQLVAFAELLEAADPGDGRAAVLRHLAAGVNDSFQESRAPLGHQLLRLRLTFQQLQSGPSLLNLTARLQLRVADLQLALADKAAVLDSVRRRFDQTVQEFLPRVADFGDGLLRRLLSRVGGCSELPRVLQPLQNWCGRFPAAAVRTGVAAIAAALLLHCLLLLQLLVFRAVWRL